MNLQAVVQSSRGDAVGLRLKDSLQAVERVLTQVRDLSLNLRPSMLDDLGLEPALRWYTTRQASLAGLAVEFHAEALEDRLDPVIETACFRVAQEAMTNVVRHARARALSVELAVPATGASTCMCVMMDGALMRLLSGTGRSRAPASDY